MVLRSGSAHCTLAIVFNGDVCSLHQKTAADDFSHHAVFLFCHRDSVFRLGEYHRLVSDRENIIALVSHCAGSLRRSGYYAYHTIIQKKTAG